MLFLESSSDSSDQSSPPFPRLGLSHVFTGGCSQPNDGCSDTAQQAGADYNCYPRGATLPNSCPNKPTTQPLYDPVNK
jgi:hypothetical protein